MGNGIANALAEEPPKPVRITVANQKALDELGFGKRELSTLKKYFQNLDDERKGVVDLEVFSEKIGIQARFVDRIFDITNGSRGGRLKFFEFALSMWNFLTLTVQELPHALFACYDKDNNGSLSVAELSDLSKDLQPEGRLMGPKLRQALKKFDKIVEQQEKMRYEHNMAKAKKRLQAGSVEADAGDGAAEVATPTEIRISPDFLMNFLGTNPALGQPLHQFHVLARQDIFGEKFWRKLRDTYVFFDDFLAL